jgi:DNA-directed RNA polymerase subunit RPC12/RpoP
MTPSLSVALASARCVLFGHSVHHTRIDGDAGTCARCGNAILDQGTTVSHVSHTLSCFFGRHHYIRVANRKAHHEYVCERCGHPLLFELFRDPYARQGTFEKRVSYACGLLGHRVHVVATRSNATEYACVCGHSFVKAEKGMTVIRHPLACVVRGHFITANETRGEWAEYVCRRCGHPFCFKIAGFARREWIREQRAHG